MHEYRHIAIGGVSYVGSTTLNLILGSLPGVCAIGETHWLTDIHEKLRTEHQIERKSIHQSSYEEYTKAFQQCQLCGDLCSYYTKEFREDLRASSFDSWHEKIIDQFDNSVIVTSDKHPDIIRNLDNSLLNATIVLFKHPYNSWLSYKKRNPSLAFFSSEYLKAYQKFLYDYSNKGPLLFLQWEKFLESPERYLRILCSELKISYDRKALRYWQKEHHYIGGNYNVYNRHKDKIALQKIPYETIEHNQFLNSITNVPIDMIYSTLLRREIKI